MLMELNLLSTSNAFVTNPGPAATLSLLFGIETALIKTPLAKLSLSVTMFKQ